MSKIEIIPAILPKDFSEIDEKVSMVQGSVKFVQIDICDGQFVPNATWPYKKHDDNFDKLLKEEIGLPFWENVNYEFDLMVNRAEEVVEEWVRAGASRIILHIEMKGDIASAINKIKDSVEIGLAINVDTLIDSIDQYKDDIKFIQCMGIDDIGFQGQKFDENVIQKIKEIKTKYPDLIVSVDGGVSLESAPFLIEAGANRLVVGSAIFNSDNAFEAVHDFKRLQNH